MNVKTPRYDSFLIPEPVHNSLRTRNCFPTLECILLVCVGFVSVTGNNINEI